jgi:hypothetical protein
MRGSGYVLFCAALSTLVASRASAQGLAPPPPIAPNQPGAPGTGTRPADEQATHDQLDRAEQEDSGRHFELFWMRGELGGSYLNLSQLSDDALQVEKASAGGPMFGFGAGVRFVVLVMGARVRYNALSAFNMWQMNVEAGVKLPVAPHYDLSFTGHGGYSFVGRLGDATLATSSDVPSATDQVKIRGFNLGIDAALDYYVSPTFSVGVGLFGDVLFLNRPAVGLPAGAEQLSAEQRAALENDPLYQRSGSSAGLQLGGALRLGLHFGL